MHVPERRFPVELNVSRVFAHSWEGDRRLREMTGMADIGSLCDRVGAIGLQIRDSILRACGRRSLEV